MSGSAGAGPSGDPERDRAERRRSALALVILFAVPTLFFLDVLLGWGVLYTRDVAFYHFPGKKVLRDIVLGGEFPYWNVFVSAGQPLAANPAYGVFYPLTWLILLPGALYGFHLLALSHVYIATLGMYALLRSLGTTRAAAVLAALSFGTGGLMLSGLQLFPFLFSGAWMPLACLFTERFLRLRRRRDFVLASATLALQLVIGEPVTVLQTGLLLGLLALFRGERRWARRARDAAFVGALGVTALLLSAVQTVPMLDHYRDSVRARGFPFDMVGEWSTPPQRLAELVFPDLMGAARPDTSEPYWGNHLYDRAGPFFPSLYCGLLIAALALAGVLSGVRGRALYLTICGLSLLLSLGTHTPLLRWLYDLGLARSIRYPEKFVMCGIFATVVFGGLALDTLLRGDVRMRRMALACVAGSVILAAAAAVVTALPSGAQLFRALWQIPADQSIVRELASSRAGWTAAAVRGLVLGGLLFALPRLRRRTLLILLGVFVTIDLGMFVAEIAPREGRAFYTEAPAVLRELPTPRDAYRVFLLSEWMNRAPVAGPYTARRPHAYILFRNALPGRSPATYGVRTAMELDFDLTSLAVTDDFQQAAWALRESKPRDWLGTVAAMSNIRFAGVFRPLAAESARAGGDIRLIRPIRFVEGGPNPRYYFAPQVVRARGRDEFVTLAGSGRHPRQTAFVDAEPFAPAPGRVLRWSETANTARIEVESAGQAFLVMSVTAHKYWTITVDGVAVNSIPTNLGYQGVRVPAGRHVVAMRYRNPLIAAGAAISLATLLALALAFRR